MRLDSKNLIAKMQSTFAKILPPQYALDILVTKGPFKVGQPPFISAPIFAETNPHLQANAIAALMYESCSNGTLGAIVTFLVDKDVFTVKYWATGDSGAYWISPKKIAMKEGETDFSSPISALPAYLSGIRG